MDEHKKRLAREQDNNKEIESGYEFEQRQLVKIRDSLSKQQEDKNSLEGEVAILRN